MFLKIMQKFPVISLFSSVLPSVFPKLFDYVGRNSLGNSQKVVRPLIEVMKQILSYVHSGREKSVSLIRQLASSGLCIINEKFKKTSAF